MGSRNGRAAAIRSVVRKKAIKTQRELADELVRLGFDCTQATVSRDVSSLGLRKLPGGSYVLAEDLHLQRMLSEFAIGVSRSENLVVVRTQPGTAAGVAGAVDEAELEHVLGSVGGDDTVLIVADATENAEGLRARLAILAGSE